MKKNLFTIFALLGCLSFLAACGSDDDDNNKKPIIDPYDACVFVGSISVSGGEYVQDSVKVSALIIDGTTQTYAIDMFNVRFSSRMPVYLADMKIEGVHYEVTDNGLLLSADSIVPTSAGNPYPAYTITHLNGTIADGTLSLSMNCGIFPLSYTGNALYTE